MNDDERVARLMLEHLKGLDDYDAPYVDDTDLTSVVVDGRIDFLAFARAARAAGALIMRERNRERLARLVTGQEPGGLR